MNDESELPGRSPPFDPDRWTGRGRGVLIQGLFLAGNELSAWDLVSSRPPLRHRDRRYLSYTWVPKERSEAAVQCDLIECSSARTAHEAVVELLSEHQGPIWTEAEAGVLGDVGFIPRTARTLSTVLVRANVVIRVVNNERELVDVDEVARSLDDLIVREPEPQREGVVPVVESVRAIRGQVERTERVSLSVEAADPLDRDIWLKYVARGGDLEVVDGEVLFAAAETGTYEVTVYATNPNGGVAVGRTDVVVR